MPTSWLGWKERGKSAFERGDYEEALDCYKTALQPEYECHAAVDRQVLLSNVVACRLKLAAAEGDGADSQQQAAAAVQDAKQCVNLNPSWSKGHVRLASAYVALNDPTRSNDACNAKVAIRRCCYASIRLWNKAGWSVNWDQANQNWWRPWNRVTMIGFWL